MTAQLPYAIVGIGASAGGMEAYQQLLKALPIDTGMAFVLISHLDPSHQSMLAEILSRNTSMPVTEVADEPEVLPNHVYVIPPARNMIIQDGHLKLTPQPENRGLNRPIDGFLRSLAQDQAHRGIGVILSGTGMDGTLGLAEIKAQGGVTFVQDQSAAYDGMPRSAVQDGSVDFILPPQDIARELARIANHPYVSPGPERSEYEPTIWNVIGRVQDATGTDFSLYKATTLFRRVSRRILLHKLADIQAYLRFLDDNPAEVHHLYHDILINVTSFFRDPQTFEALKANVFPKLLQNRHKDDPLRVWTLGCSTGEEAYSIAIGLTETMTQLNVDVPVQIFATDLNELGVSKARAGFYSKAIAEDVSPERLRRFFVELDGGYQIHKAIREMCVFARQNVLGDLPFSRMDLISCRNLLIYMEPELQRKLIPVFHYSLRPNGYLWLGSSETIGTFDNLFETTDTKHKIYLKRPGASPQVPSPSQSLGNFSAHWTTHHDARAARRSPEIAAEVDAQREAERVILARYSPPSVVLNSHFDILQFRGDTSRYLSPAPGKPSLSVLKMAREGLLVSLRSALDESARSKAPVRKEAVSIRNNDGWHTINLEVVPVSASPNRETCFLVLFEDPVAVKRIEAPPPLPPRDLDGEPGGQETIRRLTMELSATRDYLQSLIEQQDASHEELQSANEEIQSSNEELQSINEELQTTKEEVQSTNEELVTVNEELRNRNDQLKQSNDDLQNFLSSTQLALVMLGPDLRIRRFTQQAEKLLNLIATDVGRPIGDIKLPLTSSDLEDLLVGVINSMQPHEEEVQDKRGHWYSLRLRPYRTGENKIDGAVVVLVDIDAQKRDQEAVQASETRFRSLFESAAVGIKQVAVDGRMLMVNQHLCTMLGFSREELLAKTCQDITHPEDRALEEQQAARMLSGEINAYVLELRYIKRDGAPITVLVHSASVRDEVGKFLHRITVVEDITTRKKNELALIEADQRKDAFLAMLAHELRNPLTPLQETLTLMRLGGVDAPQREGYEQLMERQVQKMVRLVDDLLDASRITHGRIEIVRTKIDLNDVVGQAVEGLQFSFKAKAQDVHLTLSPEPVLLLGDAVRLEQAVSNLLNNASKYTDHGGRIEISLSRDDARATLRLRDNGVGIAPEFVPRIFDLFVQADMSRSRDRGGLGIGLSLVQQVVSLHGGTVSAASESLGRGSEFTVQLPLLSKSEIERTSNAEPRPNPSFPQSPPRRVLLVDDNADAVDVLARLLAHFGHTVQTANDGGEAIALATSFQPEAVFLDIGLPGMDGYTVAEKLRDVPGLQNVALVALSGYGQDHDRQKSSAAGFRAHLVKPPHIAKLQELLSGL